MKKIAVVLALVMLCALLVSAKDPSVSLFGKQETISGTLTIVSAENKVIYVKSAEGITYDFQIGPATKITAADQKLKLSDLTGDVGKSIEVVFRPLKTGNTAITVELK